MPETYGSGLICGFKLGSPTPVDDGELLRTESRVGTWLHFNLTDTRARAWLSGRRDLPEEARELLLGADARIHLLVLPGAVAAVLGDLHHDFDGDPEGVGSLRLYADARGVVSGRTHPLRTADVVRRELARGNEAVDTLSLLELLIEKLAESFAHVVVSLGDQVDEAEDRILNGRYRQEGTPLGNLRRLVARLRRIVGANRTALMSLPRELPGLYEVASQTQLRAAAERLDAVGQDLELVQERARLLQEEIAARVGEATSRNLFVLSIATTTLLPITLITGIFGMNVRGLPFELRSDGFQWVMVIIVCSVLVVLGLLRRIGAL